MDSSTPRPVLHLSLHSNRFVCLKGHTLLADGSGRGLTYLMGLHSALPGGGHSGAGRKLVMHALLGVGPASSATERDTLGVLAWLAMVD